MVGIEYFTELSQLACNETGVRVLDVSKNTKLTILKCNNTNVQVLDLKTNINLEWLYAYESRLKELDLNSNPKLATETYFEFQKNVADYKIDAISNKETCDLKKVVGDISRITVTYSNRYSYDSATGIITFSTTGSSKEISYNYKTGYLNPSNFLLVI